MIRKLAFATVLAAGFCSSSVFALGLGELELKSRLSQALSAEIPVTSATADQLDTLEVKLASAAAFDRAGIDRPGVLEAFKFRIDKSGKTPRILVSTRETVREPFLVFLIDARFSGGRILREYTMFLNPPSMVEPVAVATSPTTTSATSTGAPATRPSASVVTRRDVTSGAAAATSFYERAPATASTTRGGETYGPISPKETLWSIAARLRPVDSSLTMSQTMMALYEANPESFDGNINRLLKGSTLRIPDLRSEASTSADAAKLEVARQHSSYTPYSVTDRVATGSGAAMAESSQTASTPTAKTTSTVTKPTTAGTSRDALDGATASAATASSDGKDSSASSSGEAAIVSGGKTSLDQLMRLAQKDTTQAESSSAPVSAATTSPSKPTPASSAATKPVQEPVAPKAATTADPAAAPTKQPTQEAVKEPSKATAMDTASVVSTEPAVSAEIGDPTPIEADPEAAVVSAGDALAALQNIAKPKTKGTAVETAVTSTTAAPSGDAPQPSIDTSTPTDVALGSDTDGIGDTTTNYAGLIKYVAAGGGALALLLGGFFGYRRLRGTSAEDDSAPVFNMSDSITMMNQTGLPGADQATVAERHLGDTMATGEQEVVDVSESPEEAEEAFDETREMPAIDTSAPPEEVAAAESVPEDVVSDDSAEFQFDIETDEVDLELDDPISEADFHLAYGLYDEASLLLTQAVEANPDRSDYKAKLLEAYFAGGKTDEFSAMAQQFHDQIADPASDPEWQKVAIMGQQIDPENDIYIAEMSGELLAADSDALDMDIVGEGDDDGGLDFDLGGDDDSAADDGLSLDLEDPAAAMLTADASTDGDVATTDTSEAETGIDADFSLDMDVPENAAETAAADAVADEISLDVDFGVDEPAAEDSAVADASTSEESSADAGNEVEFDLGDFDVGEDAATESSAEEGATSIDESDSDFGLNLDDFGAEDEGGDAPVEAEDPGSKLDLARAYVDMGDTDMARGLLEDVITSGDDEQISEAKDLMSQLG